MHYYTCVNAFTKCLRDTASSVEYFIVSLACCLSAFVIFHPSLAVLKQAMPSVTNRHDSSPNYRDNSKLAHGWDDIKHYNRTFLLSQRCDFLVQFKNTLQLDEMLCEYRPRRSTLNRDAPTDRWVTGIRRFSRHRRWPVIDRSKWQYANLLWSNAHRQSMINVAQ